MYSPPRTCPGVQYTRYQIPEHTPMSTIVSDAVEFVSSVGLSAITVVGNSASAFQSGASTQDPGDQRTCGCVRDLATRIEGILAACFGSCCGMISSAFK